MGILKNALVGLRHDPRLLKLPSWLSLLCLVVGLGWLLILPLDAYSRHTYVSENALLPGQVSTYFGGSEHNVFRAYRHEVSRLLEESPDGVATHIETIFASQGLKTARQRYAYDAAGRHVTGTNVYAMLQGPRADATEAIVLMAGWRNMDNVINQSGVALVLTLARYFKRWSLWSKDILFVVTTDSTAGAHAWVDAYHSQHDPQYVEDLPIRGGALQGALALDYTAGTGGHRFDKINLIYDGINGQLPNLDLFNTVTHIAKDHMGIRCTIQRMWQHTNSYRDRLTTILIGMKTQGLGSASGPHSSFVPYHVDAVTLQTVGDGWHDEISLGRVVESTFRSLNNLLEHLHQSFFFYMLLEAQRFTSIGTYLPAAMLIAASFSISAITLWVHSGGQAPSAQTPSSTTSHAPEKQKMDVLEHNGQVALVPQEISQPAERRLFAPLALMVSAHALGTVPLYLYNNAPNNLILATHILSLILSLAAPLAAAFSLNTIIPPHQRHQTTSLTASFSLLVLGTSLSTLSTLNFSLGLIVGLLASPLAFSSLSSISQQSDSNSHRRSPAIAWSIVLLVFSPTGVLSAIAYAVKQHLTTSQPDTTWSEALIHFAGEASKAWHIDRTYTCLIVWLIWWPAWLVGMMVVLGAFVGNAHARTEQPVVVSGSTNGEKSKE